MVFKVLLLSLFVFVSNVSCLPSESSSAPQVIPRYEYRVFLSDKDNSLVRFFDVRLQQDNNLVEQNTELSLDVGSKAYWLGALIGSNILVSLSKKDSSDDVLSLYDFSEMDNPVLLAQNTSIPNGTGTTVYSKKHKSIYMLSNWPSYSISAFYYDETTKTLTEHSNSPFSISNKAYVDITLSSDENSLYVSSYATSDNITHYPLDASTGEVQSGTQYTTASLKQNHFNEVSPDGKYLFVSNTSDESIRVYDIDSSDGSLTENANSPYRFSDGGNPMQLLVTSDSKFLYVAAHDTNKVYGFAIGSGGELSALESSPYGNGADENIIAWDLVISEDERLLVANYTSGHEIEFFQRNTETGVLSVLHREALDYEIQGYLGVLSK